MRCEGADLFADCVLSRSSKDTIFRVKFTITMVLLSFIIALILLFGSISLFLESRDDVFLPDSTELVAIVLVAYLCGLLSFTLFQMCRRTRAHHERDVIWRRSLIEYVSSYGCDTTELESIDSEASKSTGRLASIVSFIMWVASVLLALAVSLYAAKSGMGLIDDYIDILVADYAMLLVQFVLTIGTAFRYPAGHDRLQARFTEALEPRLAECGIAMQPMVSQLTTRSAWKHAVLLICTFGLYTIYAIVRVNTDFNRHITAQWDYEEELLRKIMDREGAVGFEEVPADPMNPFLKFIKNVM